MRLPPGIAVGAATHTGLVRTNNEDDFLLGTVGDGATSVLFAGLADGIGGAAGGAEASREALRGLGAVVLDGDPAAGGGTPLDATDEDGVPFARRLLREGFAAASDRLREQAAAVPHLAEMGTTMTAVVVGAEAVHFGHIGDTRLYLLRDGRTRVCTTDHAAREPDNVLLRWLGGRSAKGKPEFGRQDTAVGDRWLLLSDGVWSVLDPADLAKVAAGGSPQQAAERLVAAALDRGGPDNATAVVVDRVATAAASVDLPVGETPRNRDRWPAAAVLTPPRWPWWLLLVAALFGLELGLRRGLGIDVWSLVAAYSG